MKERFEGNESLFEGLDIHPHWDWPVKYPVVRLSFGEDIDTSDKIENHALNQLQRIEQEFDLEPFPTAKSACNRQDNVLYLLHRATDQQVAVLIDEYERPVLNAMENPDQAQEILNDLRGLYSILKSAQDHIRFVFVTGSTMISMATFSSGLINLLDISLYSGFGSLCGYTDDELEHSICFGA